MQIPDLGSISFSDHVWNGPGAISYPGGVTRSLDYDDLMRLETLSVAAPDGTPLMYYQYDYTLAGNLLTKSTEYGTYGYNVACPELVEGISRRA